MILFLGMGIFFKRGRTALRIIPLFISHRLFSINVKISIVLKYLSPNMIQTETQAG